MARHLLLSITIALAHLTPPAMCLYVRNRHVICASCRQTSNLPLLHHPALSCRHVTRLLEKAQFRRRSAEVLADAATKARFHFPAGLKHMCCLNSSSTSVFQCCRPAATTSSATVSKVVCNKLSSSWAGGQRLHGGLPTEAWHAGSADVGGGGGGQHDAEGEGFVAGQFRRASITLARCWAAAASEWWRRTAPSIHNSWFE
jgi:hypothetical protein